MFNRLPGKKGVLSFLSDSSAGIIVVEDSLVNSINNTFYRINIDLVGKKYN